MTRSGRSSAQRGAARSRGGLVLNACCLHVEPQSSVEVGEVAVGDQERLARLRLELRGTHLVLRRGDHIRVVRLSETAERIGDRFEQVVLMSDPALLCALVRERLISIIHEVGRGEINSHRPVVLVSSRDDDDLLRGVLSPRDRSSLPSWLGRRVRYEFDARYFRQVDGSTLVLLSIGVRTSNQIDANCAELLAAGVSLDRRYVEVLDQGDDHRLSARRTLVGFVSGIDDNVVRLGDARPGWERVPLSDAYLEPRAENLASCLGVVLGRGGAKAADQLRHASGRVTGGPSRLQRANRFLRFLGDQGLALAPGVDASLGDLIVVGASTSSEAEVFDQPTLIFHPSGGKTSAISYSGLDQHGPYDQAVFPHKRPRIVIICQAHRQGDTEAFVQAFFDGIRGRVFGKGFLRRFALGQPHVERFYARDQSANAYEGACRAAIDRATEIGKRWDLALVQIEDKFKELPPDRNPYLVTKAILFRHQIPAQAVTMRTMGLPQDQLAYALNNLSLACYAKLGGTPWVLEADRTVAHELVIGLRSCRGGPTSLRRG